ncbi:sporulation protein YtxC [Priestia megaterium]|uniref:sporulation protein YtxC n=1 Tax=Priestia megaterium TaxID=1404 RepID=UPI0026E24C14|nr:sporulation protein YtxC [Priestia megaterium]MDO6846847.1 sporulation protein YtxC [Priestia megaterium]
MKIFFKYVEDAVVVYESLCAKRSALSYGSQCLKLVNNQLLVIDETYNREAILQDMVIPVLTHVILKKKEKKMMVNILKEQFFYSEEEEQDLLLQIMGGIMEGERGGIPQKTFSFPRELLIRQALQDFFIHNVTFTFESFLQFRLKEYQERLRYYAELAIDEYKLEQDYQILIHQLRQAANERQSSTGDVYVMHLNKNKFVLYDHSSRYVPERECAALAEAFLSEQESLYIDSTIIAPLLSLSPAAIHLYSDQHDHDFVYTIQNIFQEKVMLYEKNEFPFDQKQNIT